MGNPTSKRAVYTAISANLLIAATKFFAAATSGSTAMLSEGFHSLVDTGNGLLILLGTKRALKSPDTLHPFGYGKELYFWTLIVAIYIFAVGGGISVYEGVFHLSNPHPLRNPFWNYCVLGISLLSESTSLRIAWREFRKSRFEAGIFHAIRISKDPTNFTILLEDLSAVCGIFVAFFGIFLSHALSAPWIDGLASIIIGCILFSVALFLGRESKDLLLGEGVLPAALEGIRGIVQKDPDVDALLGLLTMHLGPHEVLLTLNLKFRATISGDQVASAIDRLSRAIRARFPDVSRISIEADFPAPTKKASP